MTVVLARWVVDRLAELVRDYRASVVSIEPTEVEGIAMWRVLVTSPDPKQEADGTYGFLISPSATVQLGPHPMTESRPDPQTDDEQLVLLRYRQTDPDVCLRCSRPNHAGLCAEARSSHSDVFAARSDEVERLRSVLVEAVLPLEVIAGQDRAKPYRELSRDLIEDINAAIEGVRAALREAE